TTDIIFATALNHPLFGYSGANADFEQKLDASPVVNVGPYRFPSGYHRVSDRPAPYNYFSNTALLYTRAPAGAGPPPPLFTYGTALSGGQAAGGLHLEFRGHVTTSVDWSWDAA